MTRSETDLLRDHIDEQFKDAKIWRADIRQEIMSLKQDMPRVAEEKAQLAVSTTQKMSPAAKWTAVGVCVAFFGLLISLHGNQTKFNTHIESLRKDIHDKKVIESSLWIQDNKKPIWEEIKRQGIILEKVQQEIIKARYNMSR